MLDNKIDLVRAFLQIDGQVKLNSICNNYDKKGGIEFAGYEVVDGRYKPVKFVMDKYQVGLINECQSVIDIYECYKEMEYFNG